jgi:cell division protein FtsB
MIDRAPANHADGETAYNRILEDVMQRPLNEVMTKLEALVGEQDHRLDRVENRLEELREDLLRANRGIDGLESRLRAEIATEVGTLQNSIASAVDTQNQLSSAFAAKVDTLSSSTERRLKEIAADVSESWASGANQLQVFIREQLAAETTSLHREIANLEQKRKATIATRRWAIIGAITIVLLQLALIILQIAHP